MSRPGVLHRGELVDYDDMPPRDRSDYARVVAQRISRTVVADRAREAKTVDVVIALHAACAAAKLDPNRCAHRAGDGVYAFYTAVQLDAEQRSRVFRSLTATLGDAFQGVVIHGDMDPVALRAGILRKSRQAA